MMRTFLQDLHFGSRMLLKNRGFAAVAVITLALGIGANTALFSVVNAVLLRPLPYKDPDQLLVIREMKMPQFPEFSVSPGNFLDWQKQNTVFEQMAALRPTFYNLVGNGDPERIRGVRVSATLFTLLGAEPAQGRVFLPEEDRAGSDTVALISHGLWQRRFGADPDILGKTLNLSGREYTVVGIMPPAFRFPGNNTELWTPMAFTTEESLGHGAHYLSALARLKADVSLEQARSEMSAIAGRLEQQYPDSNTGWGVKLTPMLEYNVGQMKPALLVLLGAVAMVLLIACANVANLLLARATARQKEIAIRTALGASRIRIVRQLLTESLLLSLVGGAMGLLLTFWSAKALLTLAPENLPRLAEAAIDLPVLGFSIALTFFTGLVFGLAPAIQASKPNLNEVLKDAGRGSTAGAHRQRARNILVIAEVALALVLLLGAGLMIKSFSQLQQVNPGFNPKNVLSVTIALPPAKYADHQARTAFGAQLMERLATVAGVEAAGISQSFPFYSDHIEGFTIEGQPPPAPGEFLSANYYAITPDYFKAMGIPLLRGRLFTEQDKEGAPRVAVISETMAKRFFPNEDPLGKRIIITNTPGVFREIVGLVGDVKQYGLDTEAPAQMYEPYLQRSYSFLNLAVRTAGDPTAVVAAVRAQVLAVDKDQPVSNIKPVEQLISDSVARQRFSMFLLTIFAAVALVLAAVGLYGVMAYSVTQRTHEMGIRIALGARPGDVMKLVLGQAIILTSVGIVIGLAGAFVLTRLMSSLLFRVSATDPAIFLLVSLTLASVAIVASYLPARKATRVDPMIALRYE